jgi:hypothetical protein
VKKNKKKALLIILILVVVALSSIFTTYALYRSSTTGSGSIKTAKWSIKVDGTDIASASYTFDASDVTWTKNVGENDTIAPGAEGYIEIPVDATGSEVGVVLTATMGSATLPTGMTATVASGSGEQTIAYNASDMSATVRINIAWAGALSDDTSKDTSDKSVNDTTISIPITLTARQVLPQ